MAKPLSEQVVVITGASSGIGRLAALQFGKSGASVVLAARNGEALAEVENAINGTGGRALAVVTDVSDRAQVRRLAEEALARFGRIDTWVNNAGVSTYATVEDSDFDEIDRILQVNFMGQVYGMKAALDAMKQQESGVIINVGSVESERAVPFHAAYAASKHAVKGFTEAFRMELMREHPHIQITLIKPAGIDTPFFVHSVSKIGVKPRPPRPVYQPELVAEAILHAAEHPQRDITIGEMGSFMVFMQRLSPGLFDKYMTTGGNMFRQQMTDEPEDPRDNVFDTPPGPASVHGDLTEEALSTSPYTRFMELHPARKRAVLAALAVAAAAYLRSRRKD